MIKPSIEKHLNEPPVLMKLEELLSTQEITEDDYEQIITPEQRMVKEKMEARKEYLEELAQRIPEDREAIEALLTMAATDIEQWTPQANRCIHRKADMRRAFMGDHYDIGEIYNENKSLLSKELKRTRFQEILEERAHDHDNAHVCLSGKS